MAIPETYLQLCQKVHERSGLAGTPPQSVSGQSGMNAKIVSFVADAWLSIQNLGYRWRFKRTSSTVTLSIGGDAYAISQPPFSLSQFLKFDEGSIAIRSSVSAYDRSPISVMPFERYQAMKRSLTSAQPPSGRPSAVCQITRDRIGFNRTPEIAYVIDFDYWMAPQILAENENRPVCPKEYNMAIVGEALRILSIDRADPDLGIDAVKEGRAVLQSMILHEAEMDTETRPYSILGADN